MQTLLIVIHVITCIILVVTVLLQQGKGAEVGAVFGSSEAIFGSAGPATLLSKITTACAIIFMLTSLSLTYLSIQKRGDTVMHGVVETRPITNMPAKAKGNTPPISGTTTKPTSENVHKLNDSSANKVTTNVKVVHGAGDKGKDAGTNGGSK